MLKIGKNTLTQGEIKKGSIKRVFSLKRSLFFLIIRRFAVIFE